MITPYIGVTGVGSPAEAKAVLKIFKKYDITMQSYHIPMIGVLVSHKTVKFGYHPTKKRYPILKQMPDILKSVKDKCLATIHYNTKNAGFLEEVKGLLEYEDIYERDLCPAIQLNILAPSPLAIQTLKQLYPEMIIILQLNKGFLDLPIDKMKELIDQNYSDVDYVLVDPSRGTGTDIGLQYASRIYANLRQNESYGIGFAGGFSADNIASKVNYFMTQLLSDRFSIDAESKLRDEDDSLDLLKVERYIYEATTELRCERVRE